MNFKNATFWFVLPLSLAGCQSNADDYAADVYQNRQLNAKQETKDRQYYLCFASEKLP